MELLTNSRRNAYGLCNKKHYYSYEQGYKSVSDTKSMYFGRLFHDTLEQYYKDGLAAALAFLDDTEVNLWNEYDVWACRAVFIEYQKFYNDDFKILHVEKEFTAPLINPETNAPSRTWLLAGKMDLVIEGAIVEHKTSSQDITPGSAYWRQKLMDSQISQYVLGARAIGIDVQKVIYNVIKKPSKRPLKATENPKYKKDGTLYANMREHDESPLDYAARISEDIKSDPKKYFIREEVPRLLSDLQDYEQDMWDVGQNMKDSKHRKRWPRNAHACFWFNSPCVYFDVCTGVASIDDTELFEKVENIHPELSEVIHGQES